MISRLVLVVMSNGTVVSVSGPVQPNRCVLQEGHHRIDDPTEDLTNVTNRSSDMTADMMSPR